MQPVAFNENSSFVALKKEMHGWKKNPMAFTIEVPRLTWLAHDVHISGLQTTMLGMFFWVGIYGWNTQVHESIGDYISPCLANKNQASFNTSHTYKP